MSGVYTPGMPAFSGAFTGTEAIPCDTGKTQGIQPESCYLSPTQLGNVGVGVAVSNTDGATVTVDWSTGSLQKITMAGNRTFVFNNPSPGQHVFLEVTQDGTGSRTATWPASVKWPAATAPTLTTTAGHTDVLEFIYDSTRSEWLGKTYGLNYTL